MGPRAQGPGRRAVTAMKPSRELLGALAGRPGPRAQGVRSDDRSGLHMTSETMRAEGAGSWALEAGAFRSGLQKPQALAGKSRGGPWERDRANAVAPAPREPRAAPRTPPPEVAQRHAAPRRANAGRPALTAMKKHSALTAALAGPAKPDAPGPAGSAGQAPADASSFPCLGDGAEDTVSDLSSQLRSVSLKSRSLAGSAPTAALLANGHAAADYELNPHRRRGGGERLPLPASSMEDKLRWQSLGSASLQGNFVSDALLGSLPRGLSADAREKIYASTPMSPALNLLSSLPSDKVSSRTLDGQKLRRHVLRGAVIVFVTAGYSGKRFIFEKAKELGVRSVILDGPDSWSQNLESEGVIERFVGIDFAEADTAFERCLAAVKRLKKDVGELDGICTFCELAVPLVARLAEALGLPGNPPAAVDAARDKHATRATMAAARLPTPRNMLITDPAQIPEAAAKVGFPAVIKPIYGAASIGVVRVDNEEDLHRVYVRVQREMAAVRVVAGALQSEAPEEGADAGNAATWIKTTLMLEEYLDGPEVDVDVVMSFGQAVYGAITDNWPTVEPYFNETGSNCPSILPQEQQKELMQLAVASVLALGFKMGVFHVELKYTSRGARLIEVNCRMGGGPVRDVNLLVWGVDLVEEHLLTAAGIPVRPAVAPKPLMHIAEYSINAQKTGRITSVDFCKEWEGHPDVLYARPLVSTGQKVTSVTDGMPTWVAELMVAKPTVEEAIKFAIDMEKAIKIPIM